MRSAAAAPGRISLAFLCALIVVNNLNAVMRRLPEIVAKDRVWLMDFLFGTTLFNFSALI